MRRYLLVFGKLIAQPSNTHFGCNYRPWIIDTIACCESNAGNSGYRKENQAYNANYGRHCYKKLDTVCDAAIHDFIAVLAVEMFKDVRVHDAYLLQMI
ncbi:MAG: hypothetical protein WBQ69_03305 [Gallionella sp.]